MPMTELKLSVLSLRYSSWSIRPWLALTHTGAAFETETIVIDLARQLAPSQTKASDLPQRRALGSVTGLFPVLSVDGTPIHESLAICEWAADSFPSARLWPEDTLRRAQARAVCSEMATNFTNLRANLPCHVFARVPEFLPDAATQAEIARVYEIWKECLDRSGGPFLFGSFGIADAMYFPVLTRFRTYGIALPGDLGAYVRALEGASAVAAWERVARGAPRIPVYDAYIRGLGGDPDAAL
jgi:glutathione S-transferase